MKISKRKLNTGELVIPGIALLFAISYLVQTKDAPSIAIKWPYVVIGTTAVFWFIILVRNILKPSGETFKKALGGIVIPVIMIFVPIGYLIFLPYLGFSISSFLFLSVLFRLLGSSSWRSNVIVAFLMALFLHVMLITFLDLSLPRFEFIDFSVLGL